MKNKRVLAALLAASCLATSFTACSGDSSSSSTAGSSAASADASSSAAEGSSESTGLMSDEEIIKKASSENKVGNWGLGNEYEIQALLSKYGLPTDYITMDFTMDQIDKDTITLASAMTFNELGLIKNSYDGGYNYGDEIGVIDMNDEGVAMLEDNLFCTKEFAKNNPNTVKAFVAASMKGCGSTHIYDGTFTDTIIEGQGLAVEYLRNAGYKVFSENMIEDVIKALTE